MVMVVLLSDWTSQISQLIKNHTRILRIFRCFQHPFLDQRLNGLGNCRLTFRSVGIIIELRDGVIKDFTLWEFLRFLLFMPTFSSGPIDRFKRFNENYQTIPERDELMDMLEEAVKYIMLGFLYKFIIAYILGETLLPPLKNLALESGGFF